MKEELRTRQHGTHGQDIHVYQRRNQIIMIMRGSGEMYPLSIRVRALMALSTGGVGCMSLVFQEHDDLQIRKMNKMSFAHKQLSGVCE